MNVEYQISPQETTKLRPDCGVTTTHIELDGLIHPKPSVTSNESASIGLLLGRLAEAEYKNSSGARFALSSFWSLSSHRSVSGLKNRSSLRAQLHSQAELPSPN